MFTLPSHLDKSKTEDRDIFFNLLKEYFRSLKIEELSLTEFITTYQSPNKLSHEFDKTILLWYQHLRKKEHRLFCCKDFIIFNFKGIRMYLFNKKIKKELLDTFNLLRNEGWIKRITTTEIIDSFTRKVSKETESAKDLSLMFDRNSYESGKKYNTKITQAIRLDQKRNIELVDITKDNYWDLQEVIEKVNSEWAQYKLDSGVHKISFTPWRYKNCVDMFFNQEKGLELKNYAKLIYVDWKVLGFTLFWLDDYIAHEHCFITLYHKEEFSHINVSLLKTYIYYDLYQKWITFTNTGYQLNKKLKEFKTTNWEWNVSVIRYSY